MRIDPEIQRNLLTGLQSQHRGDLPQVHITGPRDLVLPIELKAPKAGLGLQLVSAGSVRGVYGVLFMPEKDFDLNLDSRLQVALLFRPTLVLVGEGRDPDWVFGNFPEEDKAEYYRQAVKYAPAELGEGSYAASCMLGRERAFLLRSAIVTVGPVEGGRRTWSYRARTSIVDVRQAPQVYVRELFAAAEFEQVNDVVEEVG